MNSRYDFVIVGGGLSGGLLASALSSLNKNYSILLVEKEDSLGGKHTWSFHETDIPSSLKEWFLPLASKIWSSHSVTFPRFTRSLKGRYGSIRSPHFQQKILEDKRIDCFFRQTVKNMNGSSVHFENGYCIEANTVVDARGFGELDPKVNAFQKFFGLNIRLLEPHGLLNPVLMDSTVEQIDGFRFMYLLPWSETEILLEDTYYSELPSLSKETIRKRIDAYIAKKRWKISEVLDEEAGVLPIPLYDKFPSSLTPSVPMIGVRAGQFNRTTGFSLPVVLQLIERILRSEVKNSQAVLAITRSFSNEIASQQRKFCFLNRVLFGAIESDLRYTILEKFYELPEELISKFYGTRMGSLDWLQFFARKPPVSIGKALRSGGFLQRRMS